MNIKRILCPIDYSFHSKAANYYASLFADAYGAEIIYLHVNWPTSNDGSTEDKLKELELKLRAEFHPFVFGIKHTYEVKDGSPAKEIVKLAKEESIDLIVLGTHGHTGVNRLLHGSVCETVLRKASCPVMAVKDKLNINWVMPEEANQASSM